MDKKYFLITNMKGDYSVFYLKIIIYKKNFDIL